MSQEQASFELYAQAMLSTRQRERARQHYLAGYREGYLAAWTKRQRTEMTPAEQKRAVGPYDPEAALSAGGET